MEYRKVSRIDDIKFSVIGFGTWSLGSESGWSSSNDYEATLAIHSALDNGVNFFDTAPVYGFGTSEILLGKALLGKRDKVIIASKCGLVWDDSRKITNNLTEKSLFLELDRSLARLKTDYIDIYQLHWPDPNVKTEELCNTIEKLLDTKKIKYIGLSNFSLDDMKILSKNKKIVSYQGLYNIFEQNANSYHNIPLAYKMKNEILPFANENGFAVFPYSPLMQGILTDSFDINTVGQNDIRRQNPKFESNVIKKYINKANMLKEYGKEIGLSLTELVYGWLLHQKEITSVISGAIKKEEIIENVKYSQTKITEDMYEKINAIAKPLEDI